LIREIWSLTKGLNEHCQKRQEYIKDPYKYDNVGSLKNAKTVEQKTKIIQKRIAHLEKEIKTFKNSIIRSKKELIRRGIQ